MCSISLTIVACYITIKSNVFITLQKSSVFLRFFFFLVCQYLKTVCQVSTIIEIQMMSPFISKSCGFQFQSYNECVKFCDCCIPLEKTRLTVGNIPFVPLILSPWFLPSDANTARPAFPVGVFLHYLFICKLSFYRCVSWWQCVNWWCLWFIQFNNLVFYQASKSFIFIMTSMWTLCLPI